MFLSFYFLALQLLFVSCKIFYVACTKNTFTANWSGPDSDARMKKWRKYIYMEIHGSNKKQHVAQTGVCLPPECAPCCSLRPCCPVARPCCSCGLVPPDSAGTTAAWPPTTHTHYQAWTVLSCLCVIVFFFFSLPPFNFMSLIKYCSCSPAFRSSVFVFPDKLNRPFYWLSNHDSFVWMSRV